MVLLRPRENCLIIVSDSLYPNVTDTIRYRIKIDGTPRIVIRPYVGTHHDYGGVVVLLGMIHFDIRAEMDSFEVIYYPKRGYSQSAINRGVRFTNPVRDFLHSSQPGDRICFTNFSYTWPCDRRNFSKEIYCYEFTENKKYELIPPPKIELIPNLNKH